MGRNTGDAPNLKQIQAVLFEIAALINRDLDLADFYQSIHHLVGVLMPADNLYIAIREPDSDNIWFPYHVDEMDPRPEPRSLEQLSDVESSHPTDYVFRTGLPKLLLMHEQENLGLRYDAGTLSIAWLGVPLKNLQQETFGVIAVQVYHGDWVYGEQERDLLVYVSQHISAVLEIKWKNLALAKANHELRRANESLEAKVAERTLRLESAVTSLAEKHRLLKDSQAELLEQAHAAGMADIAASVLHNIGNLLNNAFVAATHIHEVPIPEWIQKIDKLVALMSQEQMLVADHPKHASVTGYFRTLTQTMTENKRRFEGEIEDLNQSLRLIRQLTESQIAVTHNDTFYAQTSFQQIVTRVLTVFSTRIESISARTELVFADTDQETLPAYTLKRALSYIIENALDAISACEAPVLTIRIQRVGDGTRLIIEDNGHGVDPEHLAAVFRLGFSTKGRHGFGLHYAANALRSVGAKLSFESQRRQGSRVTIQLPRYAEAATEENHNPPPA